jgi:hypothetical protein
VELPDSIRLGLHKLVPFRLIICDQNPL